jgi:alkylated DNA repair protein (DNA oxidative demethylase)
MSGVDGFRLLPGRLDPSVQAALAAAVAATFAEAPLYRPLVPGGKAMSVRMTNLGPQGWISDARGYRYASRHPVTGAPWPAIPPLLLELWAELADPDVPPDACLVNVYDAGARMGLHQDRDEADFDYPVISVSLGDTAIFRIGGLKRGDPTRSVRLASGDVCVLAGPARLAFHGVDRVLPGTSQLIEGGGRLNLTLRRATMAPAKVDRGAPA